MSDEPQDTPNQDQMLTSAGETRSAGGAALAQRVGRYHIKRVIATGGMGTVYEATQENPRRVVAVKVMKHGIASRSAMRRFEYEAQLLARLHHPGIAQIYEAGTHDDGSGPVPYFAMEYIPAAKSITAYAREKKLGTQQRLDLFVRVCDAVQHGHQKGIIHRDLKPGNVLVDAQGDVKIIDFGVARGTDSDLAVTTLQTDMGQLIGTLQYMSPEQCAADPHDIDVRSDVYALGVVLYELLSGKLPYDVRGEGGMGILPVNAIRVIREETPSRLSTTIGWDGRPARHLRGDVETIVSKALEKDRERRYQSTVELAQDIRRYLAGEAIVARPPSITYQLRIFARRHKALFTATAAVFSVLLVGFVVSMSLYVRAERARVEKARERDRATAVSEFFKDTLVTVQPIELGPDLLRKPVTELTAADLLQSAADRVSERFAGQPELEADVRLTLSRAFYELGKLGPMESQARRALDICLETLGSEHPDTLQAMTQLAARLNAVGKLHEAVPWAQRGYDGLCRVSGPNHPRALYAGRVLARSLQYTGRFHDAETLLRRMLVVLETMSRETPGLPKSQHVWVAAELAWSITSQGRLREGEACARDALQLAARTIGPMHTTADNARLYLRDALEQQGRYAEAKVPVQEALANYQRQYGEHHMYTLYFSGAVWWVEAQQGGAEQAEAALREIAGALRQELGAQYLDTLEVTTWYLRVLIMRAKFADAEALARDAHSSLAASVGQETPLALDALELLSMAQRGLGKSEEAERTAREVVQAAERVFTTGYYHLPQFRNHWGRCLLDLGRYEDAEAQLLKAHAGEIAMRGPEHRNTREVVANLMRLYEAWDKPDKAAGWRTKLPTTQPGDPQR